MSSNRGRYAFDDAQYGHDLTTGEPVEIMLDGHWVHGRVEHSGLPTQKYPCADGCYSLTGKDGLHIGYYFIDTQGNVCGLCVGMKVRLW